MTTPARVAEFALAAGEYVRHCLHVELDGSSESLAYLDHYVSQIGGVSDPLLALTAAAVGAYFGEVAISRFGGSWRADDVDPAAWTITLEAAPVRFRPVAMAAEAIRKEELEDWDAAIKVPSAWESAVAEALEAAGPVEAEYFYSLTGRIETIEHTVDVLTELRRREEARAAGEPENERDPPN